MNSLPLASPSSNPLVNSVSRLLEHVMRQQVLGGVPEVERIKEWIEQRQVATLAEFRPTELREVARLCLDMVAGYPGEVVALLWNGEVAEAAKELIRGMRQSETPDVQEKASALAQAVLDAGHEMNVDSTEWPLGVSRLLHGRWVASKDYAAEKGAKFNGVSLKGGLEVFRSAQVPFLSKSTVKSTDNFSEGVLDEDGKPLERRHLLEASWDDRKRFLEQVNQKTLSNGYEALDKRCADAERRPGEHAVQCTPESFGRLLAHVASRIPPGQGQAFKLSFRLAGNFGEVRDRVVFLEKTPEKGPMALKVWLYDPEVTGDMCHLRVLPEKLASLSFHDFDLRREFMPGSVILLNLILDDLNWAVILWHATEQARQKPSEILRHDMHHGLRAASESLQTVRVQLSKVKQRKIDCTEVLENGLGMVHKGLDKVKLREFLSFDFDWKSIGLFELVRVC